MSVTPRQASLDAAREIFEQDFGNGTPPQRFWELLRIVAEYWFYKGFEAQRTILKLDKTLEDDLRDLGFKRGVK